MFSPTLSCRQLFRSGQFSATYVRGILPLLFLNGLISPRRLPYIYDKTTHVVKLWLMTWRFVCLNIHLQKWRWDKIQQDLNAKAKDWNQIKFILYFRGRCEWAGMTTFNLPLILKTTNKFLSLMFKSNGLITTPSQHKFTARKLSLDFILNGTHSHPESTR